MADRCAEAQTLSWGRAWELTTLCVRSYYRWRRGGSHVVRMNAVHAITGTMRDVPPSSKHLIFRSFLQFIAHLPGPGWPRERPVGQSQQGWRVNRACPLMVTSSPGASLQ